MKHSFFTIVCHFIFCFFVLFTISACSDDDDDGQQAMQPTQPEPEGPTTTFTVSVDVPESLENQVAAWKPEPRLMEQFASLFFNEAVAVDISNRLLPENFRVVINNADGTTEDVTSQATVTQNPDGTFAVTVPGDPRVDCIIIANLNSDVEIFAPTTALNVDISPVTKYAYQKVLDLITAPGSNFTWDNYSNQEIEQYIDQVDEAIEAAGGIDAVTSFEQIDTLLETTVGAIAAELIDAIDEPEATANQLSALVGNYTYLSYGAGVFGDFQSDDLVLTLLNDKIESSVAVAQSGDQIDINFAAFEEFEIRVPVNVQGNGSVIAEVDADTEAETETASVANDLTLNISIPAEEEIEGDSAYVELPEAITLRHSNGVFAGVSRIEEQTFGVVDNAINTDDFRGSSIETNFNVFIKKPDAMTTADLNGKTFGFADKFYSAEEVGNGIAGYESGVYVGTMSFTDTTLNDMGTDSGMQILSDGNFGFFGLNESDDGNANYTMPAPGVLDVTFTDSDPGVTEQGELFVSPDLQMIVGTFRELNGSGVDTVSADADFILGVALPTDADQSTLAGKTYDLEMLFNILEPGYTSVNQFPSLSLVFDEAGQARLQGIQLLQDFAVPPAADLNGDNFIAGSEFGPIDQDDTGNTVPIQAAYTVAANGKFSIQLLNYQGEDNIFIDGYVQDGAGVIVGTVVVSSELATPADPGTLNDPFLDSGMFIGYTRD